VHNKPVPAIIGEDGFEIFDASCPIITLGPVGLVIGISVSTAFTEVIEPPPPPPPPP